MYQKGERVPTQRGRQPKIGHYHKDEAPNRFTNVLWKMAHVMMG